MKKKKKATRSVDLREFSLYRGLYRESGQICGKSEKTQNRDNLIDLYMIWKYSRGNDQVHKPRKSPGGIFDSRRKKKLSILTFTVLPPPSLQIWAGGGLFLGTFFLPDLLCGAEKLKSDSRIGFVSGSPYDVSSRRRVGPKNKKIRAILNF